MVASEPDPPAAQQLDALPYGVVALSDSGEILSFNRTARALVPGLETGDIRVCSELFACTARGAACERGCLVARVAAAGAVSPEVRIDSAGGASPGALWVTASALPAGGGVMLHLRPGLRGDRRRRSDAPPTTGPELRIRALGRTQVEALDDSVHGDWLTQRPGRILKYLVTERSRVVLIDEIVEAIWPEAGPRAVANARYAIHRLRLKLEPRRGAHKPPAFVVSRGNGYALDRERVWIDADDFERAIDEGRAAMSRLDPASAAQHLERATALYRGPFLTDEPYAHWAVDERNRLAGMAIYALRVLTALAKERNDVPDAIGHLQRLSELEPLDGAVHRELCHALLAEGRRSEAKRRYVSFAARLRRELGEAPDFDLRSLASVDPEAQAPTPQ